MAPGAITGSGSRLERILAFEIVNAAWATLTSSLEFRFGGNATSKRLFGKRLRIDSIGGARSLSPEMRIARSKRSSYASSSSRTAILTSVFFSSCCCQVFPHLWQVMDLERKLPVIDLNPSLSEQSVDEQRLSLGAPGIVANAGGEVPGQLELLVGLEQRIAHCPEVKPTGAAEASLAHSVVQVEPVDVGNDPFGIHGLFEGT